MRERPILFSSEMIRAILDGRKTQTRRVLDLNRGGWGVRLEGSEGRTDNAANLRQIAVGCPYGQPGDRLWVREAFARVGSPEQTVYRADEASDYQWSAAPNFRWHPSIHMPRKVSRITLELTDVRVQRVQEIDSDDCLAEGVSDPNPVGMGAYRVHNPFVLRDTFRTLWDSLNEKRGYAWESNPWIWALTFRRIESVSTPTGAPHDAK